MSLCALITNRWITIVLALVIALQSMVAIGEAVQPHHPETLHPAHDHEYSHERIFVDSGALEIEESSTSSDPSLDHSSDHCHQNHVHFYMVLVSAATNIAVLAAAQCLSDYQASHTSVMPPSLFRPPIA